MDIELVRQLVEQINDLKRRVEHLEHIEYGSLIFLNQPVRVLDDTTTRTASYINNAVQVTGTGGLPSQIRAVCFSMYVQTAAANSASVVIENPSYINGAFSYQSQTNGAAGTVGNFTSLDSNGRLRLNLATGSYTRLTIDVWAYVV